MDEDAMGTGSQGEQRGESASPPPVSSPERPRRRWKLRLLGIFLVLLPVLAFVAWTAAALGWTYSRGERAGYIQKFSQRGWLCKTWEGELAMVNVPGTMQERFVFSVRDDSVARAITNMMGSRVALSYEQHRGVPTHCFGDTEYFVTAVHAVP